MADDIEQSDLDILDDDSEVSDVPAEEEVEEERTGADDSDSTEFDETEAEVSGEEEEGRKEEQEEGDDESDIGVDVGISVKKLEKDFPNIFKKFPTLKSALWREQKFTEFFPTLEQARDAYRNSQAFTNFESEIMSGQSANLLSNVKQLDERSFRKFATNILPSLQKVDSEAFNSAVGPVVLRIIQNIYATGVQHNNEDLTLSAQHISRYLFGDHNVDRIQPPQQQNDEISQEEQRIRLARYQFFNERKNTALGEVVEQTDSKLQKEIESSLGEEINEFTKSALVDKILKRVNEVLSSDERHMNAIRSMWEKAERAGFSAEWRNRIRNYYLNRARAVLPAIRSKAKAEASKRTGNGQQRNTIPTGRVSSGSSSRSSGATGEKVPLSTKQIDYSKTSDLDILNGKITRKQPSR